VLFSHAYRVREVLPHIGPAPDGEHVRVILDGDEVGVTSVRLQVFKRSCVCVECGREGVFFRKEKHHVRDARWHLNFYAVDPDGRQVLMTKDHIIRVREGGGNDLSNLRTMCEPCNGRRN